MTVKCIIWEALIKRYCFYQNCLGWKLLFLFDRFLFWVAELLEHHKWLQIHMTFFLCMCYTQVKGTAEHQNKVIIIIKYHWNTFDSCSIQVLSVIQWNWIMTEFSFLGELILSEIPCNIQGYHFTSISLRFNCGSAAVRLLRLLTNQLRLSTSPHMSFPNACPLQQPVLVDWAIK